MSSVATRPGALSRATAMARPKRILLALVAAGVLAIGSAGVVAGGTASLTVTPTPVELGTDFTLAGCGYPAPTSISFHVVGPDIDYFTAGEPLTDTCFSETWTAWWPNAGAYSITSYYRSSKGSTKKATVVKFTATMP
jgi:hypothetical protein